MPIYEYKCAECGETEEAVQKFSDPPLTECKKCSGKLKKLISQSSFHLKGSGWYVTDYGSSSKNGNDQTSANKGKKEATSSSDDKKSEKKKKKEEK